MKKTQLHNKRIVVLGLGLTGMSFVRFLHQQALNFVVNDSREHVVNAEDFITNYPTATLYQGQWHKDVIAQAQVLLVSPGVDINLPEVADHIPADCQVLGDVELYCQLTSTPTLAVTGSNGKSTVVNLLAHIGNHLGINCQLGGNVGVPVLDTLADDTAAAEMLIMELSSFQLETLSSMKAIATTILNISDDHLDRHKTIANYQNIKQKIYQQTQIQVFNRDDYLTTPNTSSEAEQISFGVGIPPKNEFGLVNHQGDLYLAFGEQRLIAVSQLPIAGLHNALNCLAALALGYAADWSLEKMTAALPSFVGLPHRCQAIASNDDKLWINDSKATNVGATLAAIEGIAPTLSADQQLYLIAGGDGKGADFSPLASVIKQSVAHVFALGKDANQILALTERGELVTSIEDAVINANSVAQKGDVILLSPACASIDMFKNFAARGDAFVAAVEQIMEAS